LTVFSLNKQAKMQWLPNANQSNVGNLNNVDVNRIDVPEKK